MPRLAKCLLLVAVLVGCERQEPATPTTTIAPPPPVEGQAPPVVASADDPGATSSGPTTTVRGETPDTFNPGGQEPSDAEIALVAPADSLAPYATALAIVQPDAFAVIKFDMAAMRSSAFLKSLPLNPQQMAGNLPVPGAPRGAAEEMAKGLEQVETLWVSLGPPRGADGLPVTLSVYAHCTSPQAARDALAAMQLDAANADRVEHQGVAYYKSKQPGGPVWAVRASDVFVNSDEEAMRSTLSANGTVADAELLKRLASAKLDAPLVIAGSFGPLKMSISQTAIDALKQSPIPLSPELGRLPAQINWAVVSIDPDAEAIIDIDAEMDAEQSAENFKTSLEGLVSRAKIMLGQQAAAAAQAGEADPETQQAINLSKAALSAVKVTRDGQHVDASFNRFAELADLPAMLTAQLERARAMQAMVTAMTLKTAAQVHRQSTGRWPTEVKDGAGAALLSWRFELLPYVESDVSHEQMKRDEPWDGTTNGQFADKMPDIFATPSASEPNTTTWKMLHDHPSGILLLDAGKGTETPWLKPDAFAIDPANPEAALGEEPAGGYIVVNNIGGVEQLERAALVARLTGKPAGEEPPAAAEPPVGEAPPDPLADQEPRIWTSGRTKLKAVLLGVEGEKIRLKRVDTNREFTVPLARLSEEDQAYIRSLNLGM